MYLLNICHFRGPLLKSVNILHFDEPLNQGCDALHDVWNETLLSVDVTNETGLSRTDKTWFQKTNLGF